MDIDALRSVAPAGAPQPGEETVDVAARRTARSAAVHARAQYRRAQRLDIKRNRIAAGSGETMSRGEWQLLSSLDDDSLRRWTNDLTIQAGNGTIRRIDGTPTMLGSNTHSNTRRVLDRFEPLRAEQLDLTQYI